MNSIPNVAKIQRIRTWLDVTPTLAMIVASVAVVFSIVVWYVNRRPSSPINEMVPAEPISIGGAAVEGVPKATLALVEYGDFQCPACGDFARQVLPRVREKYIQPGRVLHVFRNFPVVSLHPFAFQAAKAAVCAGRDGKFWQMHDQLYRRQDLLDEKSLQNAAVAAGVDSARWQACLAGDVGTGIQAEAGVGMALAIAGTPTFFVGPVGNDGRVTAVRRFNGSPSFEMLSSVLDDLLKAQ